MQEDSQSKEKPVLDVEHARQLGFVSVERPAGPYVATPPGTEASPPHCWAQLAPPHPAWQ
jgi:hypothetical protein